ncbi:hypothetical protein ENSA5_48490 [Enhygromyxa salina]|uniref:Uncharacterized protein n=1 Tax=Enhygromyxa salina TaxID=215803 RepID=A0A2S9XI69_9BACT|nr:hypothetical protein [Enhygromyxa salina]PRP92527.1 hypothetical protein ENSA5_48490 [Enhygromyxa salina]
MNSHTPTPTPALDLRCREAEWVDRPATISEFGRPAPASTVSRFSGLAEVLVADAIARRHYEIDELAGGRVILTCETPRYGIPLGVRDLDHAPVENWRIREQVSGDLIDAGPDGRLERCVAMQVRRGLIAVAGALPLLASPLLAHAGGPSLGSLAATGDDFGHLATVAPPTLPDSPQPSEGPAVPSATPAPASTTTAPPTTAAPPTAAPPTAAPPPRIGGGGLTLTGSTLWDGLLGKQVKLEMKSGDSVGGTIVAQSTTDLALARAADGTVVAVPKAEVAGVRMRPEASGAGGAGSGIPIAQRPTQDGRGLQSGGVVMITLGSIAALAGTVYLAVTPYYLFISLPLLLPGLAMVGGGAGMLVAAGKKRKAFNQAWGIPKHARVQLTPTLGAGRGGGQAGLILRF